MISILDTHVLVWWVNGSNKLSSNARLAIDQSQAIGISAISCFEIATLVEKNKLKLDREVLTWMKQALGLPRIYLSPLTPEICTRATNLGSSFHGDPVDRIIVATALESNATLITKDEKIRTSRAVKCLW